MKVLVTGGAGFIGSHVADALIADGHQVSVVDALLGGGGNRAPSAATFYREDIRSAALAEVFRRERPEVVIHHAAQANLRVSLEDPVRDAEVNVLGTLRVLDLAARTGTKQVIFASTGGALYGEPQALPVDEDQPILPTSPYGFHKYLGEQYLGYYRRVHGMATAVMRYANVYGPRQDPSTEAGVISIFGSALLAGRQPVIFGDGTQTRDFVYVGDVADANLRVLGRSLEQPVHIATGVETTVNDLFTRMRTLTGATVDAKHGPPVPGEVYRIFLSPRRAAALLGWRPKVGLEEGLRRTVEWLRRERSAVDDRQGAS
jgi:UDP-glucose 4-epimerase